MIRKQDALDYHLGRRPGKVEVRPTKPTGTQRDLSLAYSPGVAEPCREIDRDPERVFDYTARGNLVAVVSNGTAVLGLGNIGPLAAKPVMEGKGVLFKRFADIDVFDIELNVTDPDQVVEVVKALEPTFGGINLEDIKAPDCFHIESRLGAEMDIPVFHDDQHGTAIISGAAFLSWLELTGKDPGEVRVVINGAGAAGIACAELAEQVGVRHGHVVMCDSRGVIHAGREAGMNEFKERYAQDTSMRTLEDAMRGADVFMGLSVKDAVSKEMVASMNNRPLVMAMANPDPEITWEDAMDARPDVFMATGRSDYPNQVNNVLGFPFIFRGALDVRASAINMEMKLAAARALAALTREDVPDSVIRAHGKERMQFGPEYLIPSPFDSRVLLWEAPAVARAGIESGVARVGDFCIETYRERLEARLGLEREVMSRVAVRARQSVRSVVLPEGEEPRILRAAQRVLDEKIAHPVLLGRSGVIRRRAEELGVDLSGAEVVDVERSGRLDAYAGALLDLRRRRGVDAIKAREQMRNPTVFGAMMVHSGDADSMVAGVSQTYPDTIRPALRIVRMRKDVKRVAGVYMMVFENDIKFFADATVNIDPTAEELADIAVQAAEVARRFHVEPRVAMLSFSNFGSAPHPRSIKVRQAVEILHRQEPDLAVDGEMQADTAVVDDLLGAYPFSRLGRAANVLVFPSLEAGNIAYKLVQRLGGAQAVGPILTGLRRPVHVLQRGADVDEIVHVISIAAVEAQENTGAQDLFEIA